jgi:hypothetical protein
LQTSTDNWYFYLESSSSFSCSSYGPFAIGPFS